MLHLKHFLLIPVLANCLVLNCYAQQDSWTNKSIAITYQTEGQISGIKYSARSNLVLNITHTSYNLSLKTKILGIYKVEQTSQGNFSAQGFAPTKYAESTKKFATFNYPAQTISFYDAKYPATKLLPLAQDRLSALFQLGLLLQRGITQPSFQITTPRRAPTWQFKTKQHQSLSIFGQDTATTLLEKVRSDDNNGDHLKVWISPQHNFLPVKMEFHKDNGDFTFQTIKKINISDLK